MSETRSLSLQVMHAACGSELPSELRHLLLVLALLGNSESGVGWSGQDRIARALGVSDRELRRLLVALDQAASEAGLEVRERGEKGKPWRPRVVHSPVRVVRRRRGREGGKGRSSDDWRLELLPNLNRTESSASAHDLNRTTPPASGASTGHGRPLELTPQPDKLDTSTGQEATPQADRSVRGSSERSSERSSEGSARVAARLRRPRKAKPERSEAQRAAHHAVVEAFALVFEQRTGRKLEAFDAADGAAVYRLLERLGWSVEAAARTVRNAVLSDFGGTTSIRTIAADPKRFAVLRQRDPKPGWKPQSGGSVDLERGRENARRMLAGGGEHAQAEDPRALAAGDRLAAGGTP